MSDIDFDELDRAVNGALGGDPAVQDGPEKPTETPAITTVERTRMSPTPAPAPTPVAPAAKRSSGRFMDVMHPSSDMRSSVAERPASPAPQPQLPSVEPVVAAEEASWSEPLDSPFLPDAKVEKRPLGGVVPPEAIATPFDFQGLLDEPEEELLEAPEPQELIEASTMPDPIDFAAANAVSETVEVAPVEQELPIEKSPEVHTEPTQQPDVTVSEEPIGPTSITQQYKEQPSSNQESGAIFDTESYHQPVTQPVKKKTGWLVFVWIAALVILGAAAGWAVYTYVLPML